MLRDDKFFLKYKGLGYLDYFFNQRCKKRRKNYFKALGIIEGN